MAYAVRRVRGVEMTALGALLSGSHSRTRLADLGGVIGLNGRGRLLNPSSENDQEAAGHG